MSFSWSTNCNRLLPCVANSFACKARIGTTADIYHQGKHHLYQYFIRNLNIALKHPANAIRRSIVTSASAASGRTDMKNKRREKLPKHVKKLKAVSKPAPSINLAVVGTGGPGNQASVMLSTEVNRYLFNCGEGTQRLGAVSKSNRTNSHVKLSGLENIFITNKSWENTGGLLGLAMGLEAQMAPESNSNMGRMQKESAVESSSSSRQYTPKINLYGPTGVERITMMAKKFSQKMNLEVLLRTGEFRDGILSIVPVVLKTSSSDTGQDCQTDPSNDGAQSDLGEPDAKRLRIDDDTQLQRPHEVYAYICKPQPLPPKINIEKCHEAGITIGPMVGILQRGGSVTLGDGTIVHPHQVVDQTCHRDEVFLVVECPSEAYLPSLESCPQLSEYWSPTGGATPSKLCIVVHFTPTEVYNCDRYQAWMKKFPTSTDHLVLNGQAAETSLPRAREHQALLSLVSPNIFPPLPEVAPSADASLIDTDVTDGNESNPDESSRGRIIKACPGLVYGIRGKTRGYSVSQDEVNVKAIEDSALCEPDVESEVTKLRNTLPSMEEDQGSDRKYPRVAFLGTGSAAPNKIRNHSCIFVQLSKNRAVILDCGEGSYSQIYHFYGGPKTRKMLKKVQAIFISHMHADHHLGLLTLLKERKKLFDEKEATYEPVILMAPVQICRWLQFYHNEVEPVTHLFKLLVHQEDVKVRELFQTATVEDVKTQLKLQEYTPVEVIHCPHSYGVSLTHANDFKLVYSGDTRPCDGLIQAGEGCDLLIHEATHEDSLIEHAKICKHTTFSEAMDVGVKMKAKHVILTHFSQRYTHMVPLEDLQVPPNVGIAFDYMQVDPSNMEHLPKLIPALTAVFARELQKLELTNMKRSKKAESMKANV